jgi:hypothetical protein
VPVTSVVGELVAFTDTTGTEGGVARPPTFNTTAAIAYTDGIYHDLIGWSGDYPEIVCNHTGNGLEIHSTALPQEWRMTIRNLHFNKGASNTPARGISIEHGAFIKFERVRVRNCTTNLYGDFSNTNHFSDCTFSDGTTGVQLTGVANEASHLNTFDVCFFRANDVGLRITNRAHGNTFNNCTFDYTGASDLAVLMVAAADETDGQTWNSCWFEGGNSAGALALEGGSNLVFDRCRFAPDTTSWPIVKVSGFAATDVAITDPIVSSPSCWATLPRAVTLVYTQMQRETNVMSWGAKGDGTTDDTAEIQRAIDYLGTTGGKVVFPLGTYLISRVSGISHDSMSTNYCLRVGDDTTHGPITFDAPRGTIIKLANAQITNSVPLLIDGASTARRASPTTVRGITFNGNNTGSQTAWNDFGLITSLYADNITVEDCTFKEMNFAGMHVLRDCRAVNINNNFFDATATTGMAGPSIRIEVQDAVIQSNRFLTDAVNGKGHLNVGDNADIELQGHGMRVVNNSFAGAPASSVGVDIAGVSHCTVIGNIFRDVCHTSSYALAFGHYTNANGTVYDGMFNICTNNIFFNVRFGIKIAGNASSISGVNYTAGAVGNIIADNIITSDPVAYRTALFGGLGTYPERFSGTPNVVAINLNTGIQVVGQDKTSGTATSATSTTLVNSGASMGTTQYVNFLLVITGGTGRGQVRKIASHTATTFTVSAWDVTPDTTSTYRVTNKVGHNTIARNKIHCSNNTTKAIEDTCWIANDIIDNIAYNSNTGTTVFTCGSSANNPNAFMRGNKAFANNLMGADLNLHTVYQDENGGTGAIASGTTSVVVTHRMGRTPLAEQINVLMMNNPTNDPGFIYVSAVTSTTFTVACRSDPGAGGLDFAWLVSGVNNT